LGSEATANSRYSFGITEQDKFKNGEAGASPELLARIFSDPISIEKISGGRDWNYINGQFRVTVEVYVRDAPIPYMIGAGTTQRVSAVEGCLAGIDANTTIQSLDVEPVL
jgi:hypothetical protein